MRNFRSWHQGSVEPRLQAETLVVGFTFGSTADACVPPVADLWICALQHLKIGRVEQRSRFVTHQHELTEISSS